MGYQTNTTMIKLYLIEQAKFFAKQYNDPAIIFKELFLCLKHNKMLLPGYTTVQDIISQASNQEEKRLFQILSERLTVPVKDQLEGLLSKEKEKLNIVIFTNINKKTEITKIKIANEFLLDIK